MRTPNVSLAIAALAFGALTACAQPPRVAMTTTTSHELVAPAEREASPEPAAAAAESSSTTASTADADEMPAAPAGQRVCKTTDGFGVRSELYVDGAKATLRRLTPSGTLEDKPLKVERVGNVLFADVPGSEDLAVHAVTLRHAEGKTFLRQGDWNQAWSACQ